MGCEVSNIQNVNREFYPSPFPPNPIVNGGNSLETRFQPLGNLQGDQNKSMLPNPQQKGIA